LPLVPDPELKVLRAAGKAAGRRLMPYPKMTDELPEDEPETDDVLVYARRVARWQIQNIEENPSMNQEKAAARVRDARTLNELVRTLERLDALEKNRNSGNPKTKAKDDSDLKAALIGRLDQLVATSRARDAAGKPKPG
jgi:hypothetical protein